MFGRDSIIGQASADLQPALLNGNSDARTSAVVDYGSLRLPVRDQIGKFNAGRGAAGGKLNVLHGLRLPLDVDKVCFRGDRYPSALLENASKNSGGLGPLLLGGYKSALYTKLFFHSHCGTGEGTSGYQVAANFPISYFLTLHALLDGHSHPLHEVNPATVQSSEAWKQYEKVLISNSTRQLEYAAQGKWLFAHRVKKFRSFLRCGKLGS